MGSLVNLEFEVWYKLNLFVVYYLLFLLEKRLPLIIYSEFTMSP